MKYFLDNLDQIVLMLVGVFIAFNPSTFVRGFGENALKTQKLVRIMGIILASLFFLNLTFHFIKK